MINETLCAQVDGAETAGLRRTLTGVTGHAVYGPYEMKTHGVYQVEFTLALAQETSEDVPCAVLDVAGDYGFKPIAARTIRTSELSTEPRSFAMLFVIREIHRLEYRIATLGTHALLVADTPKLTRISAILDEPAQHGLEAAGMSAAELGRDTRRILAMLRPYDIAGHDKVRIGKDWDGGYVCIDDFAGIDTAFSFGINDDISWDSAVADRGLTIYQFDHTVADPAPDDARMVFEAKRIDAQSGPDTQALGDLIRTHDKRGARPNLILKMDIEGGEWPVFDATREEDLARLAWITCELHYFQGLSHRDHRALVDRCLAKLDRRFAVAHVHGNVWGGFTSIANTVFPNVIEVTFVNRALYETRETTAVFPGPLDQSCDPDQPDFCLGSFRY